MRTHGWGGDPPADDDEAIRRILDATRRCIDQLGAGTGISDVARELGVTRQTVYRYFTSSEALLSATAVRSAATFLDALEAHLAPLGDDPAGVAVEAVAYTLERLPHEPYLGLLLQPDQVATFGASVTSEPALALARGVIDQFPVDWSARGVDSRDLDEMAEHLLRVIQSFVVDPGDPPRRGDALRRYLHRWVGPAVALRGGADHAANPDRREFVLDGPAADEWEAADRRPPRDLPGLRQLMQRPSPFTED